MLYTIDELNNILQGLVGNVQLFKVLHKGINNEPYYYLVNLDNGKDEFGITDLVKKGDLDGLISAAYKTKKVEYSRINTICMDLIGKEVWVDKEILITVAEIKATEEGTIIVSTNGRTYNSDSLWIET